MSTKLENLNKKIAAAKTKRVELTEALTKLDATIAELNAEREEASKTSAFDTALAQGLAVGTSVSFEYGRGPTRRTLVGTVKAFKPAGDKDLAQYRIETGEGFDATVLTVFAASVLGFAQVGEAPQVDALPVIDNAAQENR